MADRLELDEDAAHRAGDRAKTAGERLREAHGNLLGVLQDKDGCWGTDDIGKAFAKNYVQYADDTSTNTGTLATNFVGVGDATHSAVDDLADTDAENAAAIDKLYADNIEGWAEKA